MRCGNPASAAAPSPETTLSRITATVAPSTAGQSSSSASRRSSIPIETKNRLLKTSRSGETSATTWCPKCDSESSSPAAKAPSASERPSACVATAAPRQKAIEPSTKLSRRPVRACRSRIHGITRRAVKKERGGRCDPGREAPADRPAARRLRPAERGDHHQHRHQEEVLEETDADHQPPVRGAELALLGQQLEDHGGARERDQEPEKERRSRRPADGEREAGGRTDRQRHGERSAEEESPPDLGELGKRKVEADGEEQEDDAELGEPGDRRALLDHGEPGRSEQHAGEQQPHDRGHAQPPARQQHRDRGAENDHQLDEDLVQHRIQR